MTQNNITEDAFCFTVDEKELIGITHLPDQPLTDAPLGLIIVVGGPQYRIGAHRQYVHLARSLAHGGIPVMRFDYQGIGDSEGDYPGFEHVTPDIHAAIDVFKARHPAVKNIALWGLCEGASALLLGGADHPAVSHIILANSWVRTEDSHAKAMVKHYYGAKLKDPAFWRKLLSFDVNLIAALSSAIHSIFRMLSPARKDNQAAPFPERMLDGLERFNGKILLLHSSHDLTAREFEDLITSDQRWVKCLRSKDVIQTLVPDSDHTFSTEKWRQLAAHATLDFLRKS